MTASMAPARVSLLFPVYRDEATTALMIAKAVRFLSSVGAEFEIIVVVGSSTSASPMAMTSTRYRKMFSDEYDLPPNRERRR